MIRMTLYLAAGAATIAAAAPAAAQTPYPYPQQGYPTYPQTYPQPGHPGYAQQGQGTVSQIINQLLGNRYQANDRHAVERCATAAIAQANAEYRGNAYGQAYGNADPRYNDRYDDDRDGRGYGYQNRGYQPMPMRVTAITDVQRRQGGLRVSGLLDSRGGYRAPYGQAYGYQGQGYQNQAYAAQGDLSFRCNVDYRGAVTNVRVRRMQSAYRQGY